MAKYNLTRDAWTAVTDVGILQAAHGRVLISDQATPTDGDWLSLDRGATINVTGAVWAKAVDQGAYAVVVVP